MFSLINRLSMVILEIVRCERIRILGKQDVKGVVTATKGMLEGAGEGNGILQTYARQNLFVSLYVLPGGA